MQTDLSASTSEKKSIQKLQRAIVDGLEDVKAQDIQVFDTEHLSALFERVIVASGTSNRQTRALAASVRDAVRAAGYAKPRIEGEENGEWIILVWQVSQQQSQLALTINVVKSKKDTKLILSF